MNGVLLVDKPAGLTSHDVCFQLRKLLGVKKTGHAGTLDPMATGLLVVLTGDAVRLAEYAAGDEKEYVFDIQFGVTTDTDDVWGRTLNTVTPEFSESGFNEALDAFRGGIMQTPPAYSAVKVNGRRAYKYAAAGEKIALAPRCVTVRELEVLQSALPEEARLRTVCSKGTYIRSLCRDVGAKLQCGAAMRALRRTRSGAFRIEDAHTLPVIQERALKGEAAQLMLPMDSLVMHFKRSDVDEDSLRLLIGGNLLLEKNMRERRIDIGEGEETRLYCGGKFYGLGMGKDGGVKPHKVFYSAPETNT